MTETPICPCEGFTHPQVIFNPPGRSVISYRVGDYVSFRHALLLPLKDANGQLLETELINWHPGAEGDLAVQMVEWWAYLADILTFYSDRIANESYLRSADLPESVQLLIRLLGYRPRPGIGARGVVAALTNTVKPFTLPQGFQIQSKPGPGKQPQIFELDADTPINQPDTVTVNPSTQPSQLSKGNVLLQGAVTTIKVGDKLLLLGNGWSTVANDYALATVTAVQPEKDPFGKINTRVTLSLSQLNLLHEQAAAYRLLKSTQTSLLWPYMNSVVRGVNVAITGDTADFASISRQIKVGEPVLFESSSASPLLIQVTSYVERIWYANAPLGQPGTPPDPPKIPVPIPHTGIGFVTTTQAAKLDPSNVLVHYAWQDVGQLIETPAQTFNTESTTLTAAPPTAFPTNISQPILLEDTNGQGVVATGTVGSDPSSLQLSLPDQSESIELQPLLKVLFNLLSVSRGETVTNEILGSGDASVSGQEFVLQKAPLTYLLSGDSTSGSSYKSTLRLWVNGVEWQEVPSFYGQATNATIFVTREDENNNTHVQFGDGVNGARLPSGVNNVIATYRYGSGKDAPDAGTLNVIAKPYPNLKAIRNPVPVGGGADPDAPDQIRRYAPQSVLTFGRAVSGDDYEALAALTPGVARAKVYWTWDGEQQRSLVKLYVGDDDKAREAALIALRGAADPNRPIKVQLAIPIPVRLTLSLEIASDYQPEPVLAAVKAALIHPETGLLGAQVIQIGQAIYRSQIYATCLAVPGIVAVHSVQFLTNQGMRFQPLTSYRYGLIRISGENAFDFASGFQPDTHYRHDPGEGGFFQLNPDNLILN